MTRFRTVRPWNLLAGILLLSVGYWVGAWVLPVGTMRMVFSSLAIGVSGIVTLVWFGAMHEAILRDRGDGQWQIAMSFWVVWMTIFLQSVYRIIFNSMGQPNWLLDSPITGFWPFLFAMSGVLALAAPGAANRRLLSRSMLHIAMASMIGGIIAGLALGLSISHFM